MKAVINGKAVEFQPGQTVLQVARANGIYIPSLCYHTKTGPAAKCRACVVEIEGTRGLQTACSVPVKEGMVIKTDTEVVKTAQKMVINLALSNGHHDCLACEKTGFCELQNAAYYLGVEKPEIIFGEDKVQEWDLSSPFIAIDRKKCIQCGRCVSACNQNVVNRVLSFGGRGAETEVICDENLPMGESTCVQCGECVQMCPVGALIEKKAIGKARRWETQKVRTTCPYCGVGCQLDLHMKGEQIVRVTGTEEGHPNEGYLCVKGRFGYDFIYSEDRLTSPLIREKDGSFRKASWDEALDMVASKFKETIDTYGPDSVAGVSCARSINEDSYQMQKLFRSVFKTNNIDHCART
jgi:formate dehydrogenase major subunit